MPTKTKTTAKQVERDARQAEKLHIEKQAAVLDALHMATVALANMDSATMREASNIANAMRTIQEHAQSIRCEILASLELLQIAD